MARHVVIKNGLFNGKPAPNIPAPKPIEGLEIGSTPQRVDKRHRLINADQWTDENKWVRVSSSNVARAMYSKQQMELFIEFKDGSVYRYNSVPPGEASDFFNSSSKGKFVHSRLRDRYPFTVVFKPSAEYGERYANRKK